ncbi:MAG: GatB/YqeY domain-containing protein [Candidatus Gracilibacteria bacterium]
MDYPKMLDELKQAMLARDELKTSVLRMLKSEIMKIQTDGSGTEITEEVIQKNILKLIKQRKDSVEMFISGARPELAEKEEKEIAILQTYLPEQMTEDQIRAEVLATKTEMGITDKSGFGKLMGALSGKLKGKADGATIKKIVDEELV